MYLKSKTLDIGHVSAVVRDVSRDWYDGNLYLAECEQAPGYRGIRFRLKCHISSRKGGKGAARSWDGRTYGTMACWHTHRDVFRALLELDPLARITAGGMVYRGLADFEATHRDHGTRTYNTGYEREPMRQIDRCTCEQQ